jgi:hypothetical protein
LTLAAEAAAANIPIVTFDFELDPVESGLLKSLAHPAGNVTGIFLDLPDISTAWLELLKQGGSKSSQHRSLVGPVDAGSGSTQRRLSGRATHQHHN